MKGADQGHSFAEEPVMPHLPSVAEPLLMGLSVALTQPTFQRIPPLVVGAILTRGRHTVTAMLWPAGIKARGELRRARPHAAVQAACTAGGRHGP